MDAIKTSTEPTLVAYSKTCLKRPLKKKTKIGFQDQLSLNAVQKYCRMLQWQHSAILSTFIKLPTGIKIFVLSICEWPLKTGFTVCFKCQFLISLDLYTGNVTYFCTYGVRRHIYYDLHNEAG